ncbi:MAG: protein TolQ [Alphaproteobacteria bacterium]|nr:protein TolQ [Alphaproteobacteria bacterium]
MNETVNALELAGSVSHDMSIWGLFLQADWIVKTVMLMLIAASIWSWAIIYDKAMSLKRAQKAVKAFESSFWSGGSLEELYDRIHGQQTDPMGAVFVAAMREWRRSAAKGLSGDGSLRANLRQRVDQAMAVSIGREMARLERFMTFLASVGSTAPFIGLFGTVWGIMNSFQSIAASKNTSLAVVAPGIAEALFATALGLVAAIPAVVAYNKISNDLSRFANQLDAFAVEFSAILSRQLDEER